MSMKNRLSAIFAPTAQWQTVFSSVRNLFSSCVWHVCYFMVLQIVEFQVLKGSQNTIQAVSDYKEWSYKECRWNFGKQTSGNGLESNIFQETPTVCHLSSFFNLCVDFCLKVKCLHGLLDIFCYISMASLQILGPFLHTKFDLGVWKTIFYPRTWNSIM